MRRKHGCTAIEVHAQTAGALNFTLSDTESEPPHGAKNAEIHCPTGSEYGEGCAWSCGGGGDACTGLTVDGCTPGLYDRDTDTCVPRCIICRSYPVYTYCTPAPPLQLQLTVKSSFTA